MSATPVSPTPVEPNDADDEPVMPSFHIPIRSSIQFPDNDSLHHARFIEIFPEEMRDTPVSTLLQVLKDESAELSTWADAGWHYMVQKKNRESLTILEEACDTTAATTTTTPSNDVDKTERVRILAATGIAHLSSNGAADATSGNTAKRSNVLDEARQQADQKFTQAGKIDPFFPMTWIGRGMLNLWQGKHDQATFFFQTTLKQCGPVLPALLGTAAVSFAQGDYTAAQTAYGQALRKYPHASGAASRVGFGLASYALGQVDRAKAAFRRATAIDPENVEAMVGTAILDMASVDVSDKDYAAKMEEAIRVMSMANLLNHENAMVQNHLANHYFWKWTPVNGTVEVTKGSQLVQMPSQAVPLEPGERIRIGTKFETTVQDVEDDSNNNTASTFTVTDSWSEGSATGLKVWKKDYDRVIALAKGAYGSTNVQSMQAESLFFLARVYHVRGETDHALKFYEKACKLAPALTPARFGLAQTLIVKEDYSAAKKQLQQVLATASNATDALALLGLLEARSGKQVEEGLMHLRKATELDPLNTDLVVLEAMALQKYENNYVKSLERYKKALLLMERKNTKVSYEIYANCGVLCHELKRHDEALDMYRRALAVLDEDGFKGAAVFQLADGPERGRIRHVDNAMFNAFVNSNLLVEVLDRHSKTFVKVLDVLEADVAGILSKGDRVSLGDGFETKVVSWESRDGAIVLELADEYDPMDTDSKKAPLLVVRENNLLSIPEAITVAFNIARLHEATGRTVAAIEIHKAILKRNPAYVNSYLRLACIAVDCGSLKEGSEWLKIAASTAPGNPEVLTLVGNLHLSLCDWAPAQSVFDGLLSKKIPNVDAYASLSLGNIYFANLHVNEDKRYDKHLQYAADYYRRILAKDPANAYAANGIGTVLAEKAEIFKAKEVFNRVREVSGDSIPDALLNLGHIFLAQKKHPEALQMYTNYMKRTEDGTTPTTAKSRVDDVVSVLLYIAFAFFDWARHTELANDSSAAPADGRYREAMQHLNLAIGKGSKQDLVLKYNLCMTKLQAANCVLQKLTRNIPRSVEEVEEALRGLEESFQIVEQIVKDKADGKKVNISSTTLQDFVKHCKANILSAQSHLEDERKRAKEAEVEREIRRLAAEEATIKERLRMDQAAMDAHKRQEEKDQKAEAKMKQVEELQSNWREEKETKQSEKEKRARGRRDEMTADEVGLVVEDDNHQATNGHGLFDDSDDDSEIVDSLPNETKGGGGLEKSTSSTKDLFGDSDDDQSGNDEDRKGTFKPDATKATITSMDLFGDSDEDDIEVAYGATKPTSEESKKEPPATSNDLFGDTDEDSDAEPSTNSAKRPNESRIAELDGGGQPNKKARL